MLLLALRSPVKAVTTTVAAPLRVRVVSFAKPDASIVSVSPPVVPLTVVAPLPVLIVAALPVTSVYAKLTVPVVSAALVSASKLLTV